MFETFSLTFIVAIAGFLQGLTGFGFGLIALPLLSLFLGIKTVIPLIILLAFCISITLSIQLRKNINVRSTYALMLGTLPGIPLGVYALKSLSAPPLTIGLGMLMVAFTSYQLWVKPKPKVLGMPSTLFAGFLSGTIGGSIGAGGPPIIIYTTLQPWDKNQAKATLAFYFAVSGAFIGAMQAYSGMMTNEVLHHFLIMLPALAVGIFTGTVAYKKLSDHGYRKLAFIIVFLLGCMMIFKNI